MEWEKLELITGEEYPFNFGDYVAFRWQGGDVELGHIEEYEQYEDGTCSMMARDRWGDIIDFDEAESYLVLPEYKEAQHEKE